jgi:hypothetical protein
MYEDLPEMMKDQYWDNEEFQLPYTGASQQFQKEEHVGSAVKMELVCFRLHIHLAQFV